MDRRLAILILGITNLVGIYELPLYGPFLAFSLFSSSLSILYDAQLSLIAPTVVFTLLFAIHVTNIQLQKLMIISILMMISILGKNSKWIYSILLALSPGFIITNFYLLIVVLVLLIPVLIKINGEVRALIVSGIVYLLYSSIIFTHSSQLADQISQISYFYLIFGVIGVIVENKWMHIKMRNSAKTILKYLAFVPASFLSIMFGYPINSPFIYWSNHSLYFTYLYLPWIYGIGYNSNQHLIASWVFAYLLSLVIRNPLMTATVFLWIFTFLSGVFSYIVFKRLNLKYPLLFSIIYQLNIFDPVIYHSISIFAYAFLPLTLLFIHNRNKLVYTILTLATASSLPIFISSLILPIIYRKYEYLLYALGINAFWIIPFLLLDFNLDMNGISNVEVIFSILLISLSAIIYHLKFKNNEAIYLLLIAFILLVMGINTAPLILLGTVMLFGSIRDTSILYMTLLSSLIILIIIGFSYETILSYTTTEYYNFDPQMNFPSAGFYGFGIISNVSNFSLSVSGIPTPEVSYNVKYFVINGFTVVENPFYFGFPIPAIPNYTPQLSVSYVYSNSSSLNIIYSPFNKPLGIEVYSPSVSRIVIVFNTKVVNVSGINALINNNSIEIVTNKSLTLLGGKILVNNESIFSSYYKPSITTIIGIGEITEIIQSNYPIYLPINQSVLINGKSFNHSIILPPGKYTVVISDKKIEYSGYASIFLTIISLIFLIRRFRI
ncbi:hypothetical protein V6M85_12545 [Sulfolobus tengchongensis]|uniref:Uncharacterized protein n=1 Tax=Sulfolobus tengchongensis TaxID=207809 RepID=A0AAX4KZW6_9CREN